MGEIKLINLIVLFLGACMMSLIMPMALSISNDAGSMYDKFGCDFNDISYCGVDWYFTMIITIMILLVAWGTVIYAWIDNKQLNRQKKIEDFKNE